MLEVFVNKVVGLVDVLKFEEICDGVVVEVLSREYDGIIKELNDEVVNFVILLLVFLRREF
nr:hypothetical protein [Staphylococcus epidermidis]